MYRIAIILFIGVGILLIALLGDFTKESVVNAAKKLHKAHKVIENKVLYPVNELVIMHVPESLVRKTEERYRKAGYHITYTLNLFLCGGSCVGLAFASMVILRNPFLAGIMLLTGWMIPSMVIEYITNRRIKKLDTQIGMFMRMVTERYISLHSFSSAFNTTVPEFYGEEPIYSELVRTQNRINAGEPISEELKNLADRTSNKYLMQFADYYTQTSIIGTDHALRKVLTMAVEQYNKHIENDRNNAREISEITMNSYVMLAMVPAVGLYGVSQVEDYIPFMLNTLIGKAGTAFIVASWITIFWVVTFKLGAPLDN